MGRKMFVIYTSSSLGMEPKAKVVSDMSFFCRENGFHEPERRDILRLPVDGIKKISHVKIWRAE